MMLMNFPFLYQRKLGRKTLIDLDNFSLEDLQSIVNEFIKLKGNKLEEVKKSNLKNEINNYLRSLTYQQPEQQNIAKPIQKNIQKSPTFSIDEPSKLSLKIVPKKKSFFTNEIIEGQIQLYIPRQTVIQDINIMLGSNEHWTFHSKETNVNTSEKNERSIVTINLEVKKRLNIDSNLVTLKPGKYVFDFRFQIPIEIEPSF